MRNHLFVTQDYGPDRGGMARRHVELCRRFGDADNTMAVSTVRLDGDEAFDSGEAYRVYRQPFHFRQANRFANQMKWARWLTKFGSDGLDVIHCGNIRPVGYAVSWAHSQLDVPYIVYVNGGDLLRERLKAAKSRVKRASARRILGHSAGIAATSQWVADLARDVMEQVGVKEPPPIAALDLGTDPEVFSPGRDSGRLRTKWNVGARPIMITVARLVPHKGQDTGIRALARLSREFPSLTYVMVGEGHDEQRLRALANELGVQSRVVFAGPIADADLAEAYATSNVYLGASRLHNTVNAEGFGISFLEASASALPVVAGDSGGVRSAVREGITGLVVPPEDIDAIASAIGGFVRDPIRRAAFGLAGRQAVEEHYNWKRVASDTRDFTISVVKQSDRKR
ncbi:MAG: glycosyltransferase family 4 protein [Gemmatimonadaceae bacterium]